MVLTRIGTLGINTALRQDALRQQDRMFEVQRQVSSGYVSHDYKGLATEIMTLNSNKSLRTTKEQYSFNIEFINLRTERYRFAMDSMHDSVDNTRTQLLNNLSTYDATDMMTSVRSSYQLMSQLINTEENGQQIFGGSRTDAKPWNENFIYPDDFKVEANAQFVTAGTTINTITEVPTASASPLYTINMTNPTTLTENDVGAVVQIDIAGTTYSAQVASFTDNQNFQLTYTHPEFRDAPIANGDAVNAGGKVFDRVADIVADNLRSNGNLKSINIDDGVNIEYGINADPLITDFFSAVGRLVQYDDAANFAGSRPMDNSQRNFVQSQLASLETAIDRISSEQTKNGLNQNILDDTQERHDDEMVYISQVISEIEDVDVAQAVSELQLAELSLQASFSTLARVGNTTLLNFL